tara:strand:- start:164 stop:1234 length:1071 start_codon:yes stop_codon:yes gene_type:complete
METDKKQKNEDNKEKNKTETSEEHIWTDECEKLLAEWSEKASCYRWLHGRSEKSYRIWYYCFSIPVIILSTLTGAANVGMDSFVPAESKSVASAVVGGVNIFAGIISTLQNFLKVAELMEAHRIAGVSWGKLQRNIAIELALDPSRRVIQSDFLKLSRAEYDRLIEAGPIIDDKIISNFNNKFANYEVSIPSICNGLDKCKIYKIDESIKMNKKEFMDGIEDIVAEEEKLPNKHISEPFNVKVDSKNIQPTQNKVVKKEEPIISDKVQSVPKDVIQEDIIVPEDLVKDVVVQEDVVSEDVVVQEDVVVPEEEKNINMKIEEKSTNEKSTSTEDVIDEDDVEDEQAEEIKNFLDKID